VCLLRGTGWVFQYNPLEARSELFYIKAQFVPRSKHFISIVKSYYFMFSGAKVTVCSEINEIRKSGGKIHCLFRDK